MIGAVRAARARRGCASGRGSTMIERDADIPPLPELLGDEASRALRLAYLEAYPSVRWFGPHLERLLRQVHPYRDPPELAELAAFEWAQGEVTDAADGPATGVEALAALAPACWPRIWPRMRMVFHPALRRLDLACNVRALWQAMRAGATPPPLARADPPVPWLLWRRGIEVHGRSLADDERWATDGLVARIES